SVSVVNIPTQAPGHLPPRVHRVGAFDAFNFVSRANNGAVKACPNPNAAAAPAIPHMGKNAYAKTMLAADVAATIANRGRTRLDTGRRVMKTVFARTRGLASARITRDSYPAPEYAGPKNRRIQRPAGHGTRPPV